MNDRAVNILEQYELKVLRTWKGRGAILLETTSGIKILKEHTGPREKVILQDKLLNHIVEAGIHQVDRYVRNAEGEIISSDTDQTPYVVKDYFEGKECNVKDVEECKSAVSHLANLHKVMHIPYQIKAAESAAGPYLPLFTLDKEYEKHNKELKKVRNYVRQKGQKTDFEIYFLKQYDVYMAKAFQVLSEVLEYDWSSFYERLQEQPCICHGDYQYHNILCSSEGIAVINFEKYISDSRVRDLYLFMRKLLEKNNWSESLGYELLNAYEKVTPMSQEEKKQLYYRFLYPEKFWKIANFYYNSGKSWMSARNMEKLEKVLAQEEAKEAFIQTVL